MRCGGKIARGVWERWLVWAIMVGVGFFFMRRLGGEVMRFLYFCIVMVMIVIEG